MPKLVWPGLLVPGPTPFSGRPSKENHMALSISFLREYGRSGKLFRRYGRGGRAPPAKPLRRYADGRGWGRTRTRMFASASAPVSVYPHSREAT